MQTSAQTTTHHLNLLILLQTKQTLEDLQAYKEFCYQLYLLATYNPLNKPAILKNHLDNKEVKFYYGAGGQRYLKTTDDVDTYYLGKGYEEQIKGQEETQICYISIGGKTIGTHTMDWLRSK